ncbi:Mth938-like domain-containing protein [Telmatospirillum sp.]|uniref:Mth938-like domain-containing protein n=1 Tax=Telmatospirillum sp. TaxID=2079197 RepID=UPI00284165C0|nr:Mth938-like domain-containing protein [Telmatospirillum sp.]MDR3435695.1 Mth938-like domain-containing protein [Telmatospirillum sp.]
MEINTANPRDNQVIQAYGNGGFRVSGLLYQGAVLVCPRRTIAWPITDAATVTVESLAALAEETPRPEVLLLGCGAKAAPVAPDLRRSLREIYGLSLEVMDTGAACRTYNILLAEGRPVAAALFPV